MKPRTLAMCPFVLAVAIAGGCGARADLSEILGDGSPTGGGAAGATGSGANGSGAGASNAQGVGGSANSGSQSSGVGASTGSGASGSQSSGQGGQSTSSGSQSSGEGGATQICESFGTPCTDCVSEACPEHWCGCYDNPECFALFDCFGVCMGDEACQQTCLATHADGIADVLLVSDCAGSACDGACGWGNDVGPCAECIYEDCKDETNACFSDPDCLQLFQCLTDCGPINLTCQEDCYEQFGDRGTTQTLQTLLECSVQECQDACP